MYNGMCDFISQSPEETQRFAQKWAKSLKAGIVVGLVGPLGSGKTLFVKAAAKALGVKEVVNSPTFVLASEYQGDMPIYHLDLYRVDELQEIDSVGYEEYFDRNGIVFIEWAEKVKDFLPSGTVWIEFKVLGETRRQIQIRR